MVRTNFFDETYSRVPKNMTACKADVGGVLGVKDSMIAHILGKAGASACPNASKKAKKAAQEMRAAAKENTSKKRSQELSSSEESDDDEDTNKAKPKTKQKTLTKVEMTLKQAPLKVF